MNKVLFPLPKLALFGPVVSEETFENVDRVTEVSLKKRSKSDLDLCNKIAIWAWFILCHMGMVYLMSHVFRVTLCFFLVSMIWLMFWIHTEMVIV